MNFASSTAPRLLWAALYASVLVGCSSRPTVEVSGTAKFADGSPIVGAVRTITLIPTEDTTAVVRKAATGIIAEDGSFTLYTRKPGDGVHRGKYAVTFNVLKDPNLGGLLIPEKYTLRDETPFKIELDSDRNDLSFELDKK